MIEKIDIPQKSMTEPKKIWMKVNTNKHSSGKSKESVYEGDVQSRLVL